MKRSLIVAAAVAALALPAAGGTAGDRSRPHATSAAPEAVRTTAVCHRTSSATRPYVRMRVTARTLRSHVRHAADIVPAPRGACPRTVLRPTSGGVGAAVALTGEAEQPAGDPVGTGTATVRMRLGQGQACFVISVADITLPSAGAHIHRGAVGVVGPIVVQLVAPGASGRSSGCVAVPRPLVRELLASPARFYVNVHTTDYPAGAVRGQLRGTSPTALGRSFRLSLTGAAERPPADPDGTGTAVVRIRRDDGQLCYRLAVQNIQLPSVGAHIHRAPATANGPIVVGFSRPPDAAGGSSGCETADRALLDEILANPAGFYVNVHTREYPGGAVRAQLG
jgi:CHRD domain